MKPIIPPSGYQAASETQNSPTSSKRGLRRQANYEEQPALKSGWCSNPNLLANSRDSQHQTVTVAKSASSDVGRWTSIQSGIKLDRVPYHEPIFMFRVLINVWYRQLFQNVVRVMKTSYKLEVLSFNIIKTYIFF